MRWLRLHARQWINSIASALIVLALAIWVIRPTPFKEWLGASGLNNGGTPLSILNGWVAYHDAPLTPVGFLSLFPIYDLLTLGALLTALAVLLIVITAQWRGERRGSWWTKSLASSVFPGLGMRVRTVMAVIAILGILLGWEIVAWRNWRIARNLLAQAASHREHEGFWIDELQLYERDLARLDSDASGSSDDRQTPEARAASKAYWRDQLQDRSAIAVARAAYHGELRRKYEWAAKNPTQPVPPDPRAPVESQQPNPYNLMHMGRYAEALVGFEDMIRRYPDLVSAHEQRAWISATCPDARFRSGKLAVQEATRAAELANWGDDGVLMVLAAAYAEVGDFASAVRWQERALELDRKNMERFPPNPPRGLLGITTKEDDRLALYKAGKPFRMQDHSKLK